MCWRFLAHLLILQVILTSLPESESAPARGGSDSGHPNYLEVVEDEVTYACLPLSDSPALQDASAALGDMSASSSMLKTVPAESEGSNRATAGRNDYKESASLSSTLVSSQGDGAVAVTVTTLLDEDVNASACSPSLAQEQPLPSCSFRSALLYCSALLTSSTSQPPNTTSCAVHLPEGEGGEGQGPVIQMDPRKGHVSLTSFLTADDSSSSASASSALQGTLSVIGNGCTVSANTSLVASSGQASRLLHLVLPAPPIYTFHLLLQNFTIANFGDVDVEGSGLFLTNLGNSTLSSMTFEGNSGSNGGAVFIDTSSDIVFQFCLFQSNNASIYGAGVFIYTESHRISFFNCSFFSNICIEDGGKALNLRR